MRIANPHVIWSGITNPDQRGAEFIYGVTLLTEFSDMRIANPRVIWSGITNPDQQELSIRVIS
jgi:hypothetical protein